MKMLGALPPARLLTADEAASYLCASTPIFRALVGIAPLKIGATVHCDRCTLDQ